MNIFFTDSNPVLAAQSLPDKHIVKMPVEAVQMLVSACLRHNAQPNVLTKSGTIHKGGYHKHPCTVWAGEARVNYNWTIEWGRALCREYTKRYGKVHFAQGQIETLAKMNKCIPWHGGHMTRPALAMPDECKVKSVIDSYRACIRLKVVTKPDSFVWRKGTPAPDWL